MKTRKKSKANFTCRACLHSTCTETVSLDDAELGKMYDFCIGVSIGPADSPRVLCTNCGKKLEEYYSFKKKCLSSDKLWRNLVVPDEVCIESAPSVTTEMKQEQFLPEFSHFKVKEELKSCYDYEYLDLESYNGIEEEDIVKTEVEAEVLKKDLEDSSNGMENKRSFYCDDCGLEFGRKHHVLKHIREKHEAKETVQTTKLPISTLFCGICEFRTEKRKELNTHLDEHYILNNDLNCKLCEYSGADFADMIGHRFKHRPKEFRKDIRCHICDQNFKTVLTMIFHFRSVHLNKPGGICAICNKQYTSLNLYRAHEKFHTAASNNELHECYHCGKRFIYKSAMKVHQIDCLPIRNHICDVCGKSFKRNRNLEVHKETVHTKHENIKCDQCDKIFKNKFTLRYHIKYAHDERRFKCKTCFKGYATMSDLKTHEIWHTDLRPFECELCGSKYRAKCHLKVHMVKHGLLAKMYDCERCSKSFPTRYLYVRHQASHTGDRPHKCSFCTRSFYSRQLKQAHENALHSAGKMRDNNLLIEMNKKGKAA